MTTREVEAQIHGGPAWTDVSLGDPHGSLLEVPRWLAYALLALTALTLRLAAGTGSIGSDDLYYANYGRALAEGHYAATLAELRGSEHVHYALRYGLLLPVAAVYALLGVSEWTTALVPLIASTASVVLLAEITRLLFGMRAGIIAGLLYATFPIQLLVGTMLVPEGVAEFYVLAGALCYLHARQRGGVLWVAAGVSMGVGYLTKEPIAFVAGAFLLHTIWERRWRGALLFALGVAAVAAVEHAYYVLVWGDLWFRPNSTRLYTLPANAAFFSRTEPDLAFRLFRKHPTVMLVPHLKFGLHSLVCLVLASIAWWNYRHPVRVLLALWAVVPWLYLNFGSWSFRVYAPLPTDPRYLEIVYPPIMILSGFALSHAIGAGQAMRRTAVVLLAILAGVGGLSGMAVRGTIGRAPEMTVLREIAAAARERPGRTIYSDNKRWRRALSLFHRGVLSPSADRATFVLVADPLGLPSVQTGSGPDESGRPQ